MSMRDQLLKAGLVDADKVKKTESEKRKKGHKLKKDKHLAASEAQRQAAEHERLAREAEAKRERDRELNRQREAEKRERERAATVRQMLKDHGHRPGEGEALYNFVEERWIRSLRTSDAEHRQLSRGQLAIVKGERNFEYLLMARASAEKLAELAPERILMLQAPGGEAPAEDDPWADWDT